MIADILRREPYSIPQAEKEQLLAAGLSELTRHHAARSPAYARILEALGHDPTADRAIVDQPFLPVSLFKTHDLKSVSDEEVRIVMTSSGTTGQAVSRIAVDNDSARMQTRALASSMMEVLGKARLPMLVIDSPTTVKDPRLLSARGAGVLGMMQFGRDHAFALNDDMTPNYMAIESFLERVEGRPFFMFGFTFMVWLHLKSLLEVRRFDLSAGILAHSGGWKKLQEIAVDNTVFKVALKRLSGLTRIYNFYGMVEQIGTVFMEGEDGLLYPPSFADVIVRRPGSFEPAELGEPGIIEVVSLLPRSYPGHVLLTEDWGTVHGVDTGVGGRLGKAFTIQGRVAKAELRGCSDVIAANVA